ncbi:MAG: hypothetical protein ACE5I0_10510, partial [Candidatus Binatia bacterium]
ILRQRMSFVRVQTMIKNRIYPILDRHPAIVSQAPDVSDLSGAFGIERLKEEYSRAWFRSSLSLSPWEGVQS